MHDARDAYAGENISARHPAVCQKHIKSPMSSQQMRRRENSRLLRTSPLHWHDCRSDPPGTRTRNQRIKSSRGSHHIRAYSVAFADIFSRSALHTVHTRGWAFLTIILTTLQRPYFTRRVLCPLARHGRMVYAVSDKQIRLTQPVGTFRNERSGTYRLFCVFGGAGKDTH